ncbi:MAG: PAS domain S-box protein [Desulfobulbus sp.]|nr:MAG: PAS domain S-box protein [Desulfobulbus sp.]
MTCCENDPHFCQTLLDAIPSPIFYKDVHGRYLGCNRAFAEFLDLPRERIIGRTAREVAPPKTATVYQASDRDLLKKNGSLAYESRVADLAGNEHHVLFNKATFPAADGTIAGIVGIVTDISEQKRTEEFLAGQTSFLRTIVESLPYPFYVIDVRDYSIVMANSCLSPDDSWQGRTCYQLTHHSETPCGGAEHVCPLQEVLRTRKPVTTEHIHYTHQGEMRYMEVSGYPVFDKQGEIVQLIEYAKDITELKKAEQERIALEERLRQANKMEAIGTLAGGIAHDFNNILTAILGYADMVRETLTPDSQAGQDIEQVLRAGRRARDLVRHILQFSRQSERDHGPLQVHLFVKEALKLMRAVIPANIEIRQDIDPKCGTVLSDPTEIHQIVMNLCTNAAHAMEQHGGILEVGLSRVTLSAADTARHPGTEPGHYVLLRVADTGTGMDAEIIKRIFDPYFTTKKKGEGTGMGLSVVHGIVKNHGGIVTAQSTPGQGSVFQVYFPRVEIPAPAVQPQEDANVAGDETILLVDDEKVLAEMEQRILERLGYHVESRVSSIEALQAFRANPMKFDLVITDQAMPNMTGVELARELLAIRPDLPIILCTGFSKQINEANARSLGIRAFIMKPLLKSEIAKVIRQVLGENGVLPPGTA